MLSLAGISAVLHLQGTQILQAIIFLLFALTADQVLRFLPGITAKGVLKPLSEAKSHNGRACKANKVHQVASE